MSVVWQQMSPVIYITSTTCTILNRCIKGEGGGRDFKLETPMSFKFSGVQFACFIGTVILHVVQLRGTQTLYT